jgi:hypothetical protein
MYVWHLLENKFLVNRLIRSNIFSLFYALDERNSHILLIVRSLLLEIEGFIYILLIL